MAEGTRRIRLYEPGAVTGTTSHGDPQRNTPVEHIVFATRIDRGGRDTEEVGVDVEQWQTTFRFRWSPTLRAMTPRWYVVDDVGRTWSIRWVKEFDRRWLTLFCVAAT